jgi:hypothetical protein
MASVDKFIKDIYYARSVLYHVNTKIENNIKKCKSKKSYNFDVSSLHGAIIDQNFKVYTKNENSSDSDDGNIDDDDDSFPSVDSFGDDFPNESLYRYESDIIDVLKYVESTLDSKRLPAINYDNEDKLKIIKEIVFRHNNFSFNHTYKEIKGEVLECVNISEEKSEGKEEKNVHYAFKEFLEPFYYTTIIGLVVNDHVIEFVITNMSFNRKYEDRIMIFYDKKVLLDMNYNDFPLKISNESDIEAPDVEESDIEDSDIRESDVEQTQVREPDGEQTQIREPYGEQTQVREPDTRESDVEV